MSKVTYDVTNGHVTRDGIPVASYDEESGILDFLPGLANFRAPVVRWLNKQGKLVDVAPEIPDAGAPAAPDSAPAPVKSSNVPAPAESAAPATKIPERVKQQAAEAENRRRSMSERELRARFPELPAFDKMAGDKTPAVVEYIKANDPKFAAWYYEFRIVR